MVFYQSVDDDLRIVYSQIMRNIRFIQLTGRSAAKKAAAKACASNAEAPNAAITTGADTVNVCVGEPSAKAAKIAGAGTE